MRNIARHVARCGDYEFEDVISGCDDADVIAPHPAPPVDNRIVREVDRILGRERLIDGAVRADEKYDLFFVFCRNAFDLRFVNRIEGLHENCRQAVCVISELWPSKISEVREHLKVLGRFDHVFANLQTSVGPIEKATGRPCHFLPLGVDALRFAPFPNSPARNIDVYSMGRRPAEEHRALLASAERGEMFYVYDTTADFYVIDPLEHRIHLANLIKRSRFFITYPAKFDVPAETGGTQEMGARYFEGAAGGAVMIGMPPRCAAYDDCFDWRDAVISTPRDPAQIACLVAELEAQPNRLAQIRRNNVTNSLRRHDWVYRWRAILDHVGLSVTGRLVEREAQLNSAASLVTRLRGTPRASSLVQR
jgi:Glycosyl transferases group 1